MSTAIHIGLVTAQGAQVMLAYRPKHGIDAWVLESTERASNPDDLNRTKVELSCHDLVELHRTVGAALCSVGLLGRSNP